MTYYNVISMYIMAHSITIMTVIFFSQKFWEIFFLFIKMKISFVWKISDPVPMTAQKAKNLDN